VRRAVHEPVPEPARQIRRAPRSPRRQHGPSSGDIGPMITNHEGAQTRRRSDLVLRAFVSSWIVIASVSGAVSGRAESSAAVAAAAGAGDLRALRALVRQGANINEVEPDGTTALHWAAHRGDLAAVDLLLGAGARQTANHYGVTPLALAAENGSAPVV